MEGSPSHVEPHKAGGVEISHSQETGAFMPATGELIRLMNYIDDIAATLRRINSSLPTMTDEERKRLAEYIHKSEPSLSSVLESLEKAVK
jgi:hypothetical protein